MISKDGSYELHAVTLDTTIIDSVGKSRRPTVYVVIDVATRMAVYDRRARRMIAAARFHKLLHLPRRTPLLRAA